MHASSATLKETLQALLERSVLDLFPTSLGHLKTILEKPKSRGHGDFTTTIAMQLSRLEKRDPLDIADQLLSSLKGLLKEQFPETVFQKIEILPPGFINFYLQETHHRHIVEEVLLNPEYGASMIGKGTRLQIEFVSANPTGPLSVAHGRQAAVGDALARILEFSGYEVSREYYVNDVGNQIRLLGRSLYIRYQELLGETGEIPEGGYRGRYLVALAEQILQKEGERHRRESEETSRYFERYAAEHILEGIRETLERFRVRFDSFTHESDLRGEGKVQETLELLKQKGVLYESEGATWFRSTRFGDDKDRVVVKSDGSLTYLAPDMAYHRHKLNQFQRIVNILGPDHHGYIGRLGAAVEALGYDRNSLSILIIQLATLYRDGVVVPMSTRMGEFITLQEVMEEVGVDAARFFFLMKKCSSHLEFDLSLAKKQSLENPVYTIQYAHARIANILEFGKVKEEAVQREGADLEQLKTEEELELLKELAQFPETVLSSAKTLEPVYCVLYLQKLAGAFHRFYQKYRVITEDLTLTQSRILLILCVQQVIRQGLSLLGISAPHKM